MTAFVRRCAVLLLLVLAAAAAFAADPAQMSVKVKETQIRATASYLGKIVAVLAYGDRVTILEKQKDWARVSFPAKKVEGWVNLAALQDKAIVLRAGTETAEKAASSGEVALAGKGFNADVEAKYKQDNSLDYTWVDRMEKFVVAPEQVAAFFSQGGLSVEGGAR